jgi:DNA (cytosine-5)-methyltransferase 1
VTVRVGSLFSGGGGFDIGFHAAGFETAWFCEIDPTARAVLARHWPEVPCYEDITKLDPAALPRVDVLLGGFPCQDVSVAGNRAGLAGERTGLFWEMARIIEGLRPTWLVLENVPGLLSSDGPNDMGAVLWALGERGYGWAYRVLDAQHWGVPQRRRRVFIVGRAGADTRSAASVLFESDRGAGDSAEGGEAGQGAARGADDGAGVA